MPYRLVPGPLLKLGGGAQEERRRFLVLYEIVASEGSERPPPAGRGTDGYSSKLCAGRARCMLTVPPMWSKPRVRR